MAWPCGVLNGGETPGLLLGIGYQYLRLHDPAGVAPILVLDPALTVGQGTTSRAHGVVRASSTAVEPMRGVTEAVRWPRSPTTSRA